MEINIKTNLLEYINENMDNIISDIILDFNCSPEEINQGSCEDFAFKVKKKIPSVQILSTEDFYELADETSIKQNVQTLSVYDYSNKAPKNFEFGQIGHSFLYYNGKFYDSELPKGSEDLFDIPSLKISIILGNKK